MIRLPLSSVSIGGYEIRVRVKAMDDFGQYSYDDSTIWIGPRALESHDIFRQTLWHEMGHACREIGGVSYNRRHEEESIQRNADNLLLPAWTNVERELCKRNRKR